MKKRKIIILINKWEGGGAQKVASNISLNLKDAWEQTIVVYKGTPYYPYKGHFINLDKRLPDNKFKKPLSLILRIKAFAHVVKVVKPDVVLSFLEQPNFLNIITRFIISKTDYPYRDIVAVRSTKSYDADLFERIMIRLLYNRADTVLSVSQGVRNDLVQNFHIKPDKVITICNPFDIEYLESCAKGPFEDDPSIIDLFKLPTVVTCGRLVKSKNIDLLIKAFREVREDVPSKLLIIGDGEKREDLIKLVKEMDLDDDVIFLGWQANPYRFIARSKIFVLCSEWEGFPSVLIEAMCLNIPVISTDCPSGPREILGDNQYGILIPTHNISEIKRAIVTLLTDKNLYNYYRDMGYKRAGEYHKTKILSQYERVLSERLI